MTIRDAMRTALGNLGRHKARTALTMVGVIVGILTIVTMVSLGNGVRREMRAAFDVVGIESIQLRPVSEDVGDYALFGQRPRTKLLTPELVDALRARDDVVSVVTFLNLAGGLRATFRLDGQEVSASLNQWRPAATGEPFEVPVRTLAGAGEPPPEGGAVVVSASLLETLGYERDQVASLLGRRAEIVLYAPRGESQTIPVTIAGVTTQSTDVALAEVDQ
ncbi:MAG TPA: ABC transporter permease, partial [Anaerolineae bacterium]|nr:ABC transporter permease [Anaerolineae bacterium]